MSLIKINIINFILLKIKIATLVLSVAIFICLATNTKLYNALHLGLY